MARFAVDTALDSSAPAWIATMLSLIYSTLVLCIRAYFKAGTFGKEDVVLIGAQVVACGQSAAMFVAIAAGLGNDVSVLRASLLAEMAFRALRASQVLYIVALSLSKLSMALLILRIFAQSKRAAVLPIALALSAVVWGVAASLACSYDCDIRHLSPEGEERTQCSGSVKRWLAITVVDSLFEGAVFLLPSVLCTKLQMRTDRKMKVAFAFAFRLGCIAFSVAHFVAYERAVERTGQGRSLSFVAIWQQASLCYSLISATIPVSMQFIARFTTGASAAFGSSTGTYETSSRLRRYDRPSRRKDKSNSMGARPDHGLKFGNSTSVFPVPRDDRMGSQDMIIMRQDDVVVHSR